MKQKLTILTILLFTFCFSFSQNISGVYSSDFNEMTVTQSGNKITGTYKYRNGRIEGTLSGRTLTGFWYQDNGKGKMTFEFNSDFTEFTGKWGYNDAEPSGKWNGKRIRGGQVLIAGDAGKIDGVFNSDFNELTITQSGNSVTGTYKHRNGRIEGTLSGRTLTGFWYQDNGKGKLVFEFNSDFTEFTGKWGYNDAEPSGKWNGNRIGGTANRQLIPAIKEAKIDGVFSSDFNELTITQNGNSVTGTYKYRNGRIEGTLSGRTLTGFWFQDNGRGKLVFEFNSDFTEFTGKWGYNDAEPSGKWDGKRISTSQISSPTKPTSRPAIPSSTNQPKSDATPSTSAKLSINLSNADAVAGNLNQHAIQLNVLKGTFDQNIKLEVKENRNVPQFDKKRANLIGTPFEITIDQKSKRLNKPIQVKVRLEQTEIAVLNHPGDLWMGYFNGKSWDYFKPLEVNLSEKYVKFETYHFSEYAKAQLTKSEIINDFAYKNAVSQWVENDNNALTKQATEQMVSEILSKKMGLNNKSLAQDVVEAIMQENDYTMLLVNYNDGNMEDLSQNVAVLAGEKICDIVTSDSNAKGLLGMVTEHSSKVGAAVKVAVALSEGDGETAAKELSMEILNSYPLTKLLTTTARLTEMQINRWKNQELEAAYQVFVNGADSSLPWGFQVEKGNFEELWSQLRGLEPKIYSDAIDYYAASKGMKTSELNSAILDKIRRDAKENMRMEFEKRKNQESKIETIKAENIKLISEFERANLLSRNRFGFTDATDLDFRIERLFRIKDMILKDTKSRLGFTGINSGGVISSGTVANLIQIWYSENGKEKYRQELIRLGYKKEEKKPVIVESKAQQPASGADLEGVWVGSYSYHIDKRSPENEGYKFINEMMAAEPLLFMIYNVGDKSAPKYRALCLVLDVTNQWISNISVYKEDSHINIPAKAYPQDIIRGFKNGQFLITEESTNYSKEKITKTWSAVRLKKPTSTPDFPEVVRMENLESSTAKFIENLTSNLSAKDIDMLKKRRADYLKDIRRFYLNTPAFQQRAEQWLQERKFTNWDQTEFESSWKGSRED